MLSDEVGVNFEPEPGKKLDVISSELTLAEVKYTQVESIQELEGILKAIEDAISQINEIKESRIQLESNPNYSISKESYLNQETFLLLQGKPEEALVCLDKAIALGDSDAEYWHRKSLLLCNLDNPQEALVSIDRAIAIDGGNPEYWFSKGRLLGPALGRHNEALGCYDRAIELDEKNPDIWLFKGHSLLVPGRLSEALECYDKVFALDPNFASPHAIGPDPNFPSGQNFTSSGLNAEFRVYLARLHYYRGNEHSQNGNFDEAISEYKKSTELCDEVELTSLGKEFLSRVHTNYGLHLAEQGDKMMRLMAQRRDIMPEREMDDCWMTATNKFTWAGKHLKTAIELNPNSSVACRNYEKVLHQTPCQIGWDSDGRVNLPELEDLLRDIRTRQRS